MSDLFDRLYLLSDVNPWVVVFFVVLLLLLVLSILLGKGD